MYVSSKTKKILLGLGALSGFGLLALIISRRFGFNEPPVENWRRGNNNVRATRKTVAQLQAEQQQRTKQSKIDARLKSEAEQDVKAAEWARREAIWTQNRSKIEAAKP